MSNSRELYRLDQRDPNEYEHAPLPLIDHHVHSVLRTGVNRAEFELHLTEAASALPAGLSQFDSQVGFAVRRHCAPLLDLPAHAPATDYLARRKDLGVTEVSQRLLAGSGVRTSLVDTGVIGDPATPPPLLNLTEFSALSGQTVHEIVRLETLAEALLAAGTAPTDFADVFAERIRDAARHCVGFKSIIAYRFGFHFDPARPSRIEVDRAFAEWAAEPAASRARLSDPVLLRFVLWQGTDTGLPVQLHAGYGDPDLLLERCNPALLMPWLQLLPEGSSPVVLLHCYPYHREAGYLAQVFPNVYFDIGLSINYTGAASTAVIRESLELAPFGKILYSSDAWGLPELHALGAILWRSGTAAAFNAFVDAGEWSAADAERVTRMIGFENAARLARFG